MENNNITFDLNRDNYVKIPLKFYCQEGGLGVYEMATFYALRTHAWGVNPSMKSNKELSNIAKISERQLRKSMSILEKKNIIFKKRRKDKDGYNISSHIFILEEKYWFSDIQDRHTVPEGVHNLQGIRHCVPCSTAHSAAQEVDQNLIRSNSHTSTRKLVDVCDHTQNYPMSMSLGIDNINDIDINNEKNKLLQKMPQLTRPSKLTVESSKQSQGTSASSQFSKRSRGQNKRDLGDISQQHSEQRQREQTESMRRQLAISLSDNICQRIGIRFYPNEKSEKILLKLENFYNISFDNIRKIVHDMDSNFFLTTSSKEVDSIAKDLAKAYGIKFDNDDVTSHQSDEVSQQPSIKNDVTSHQIESIEKEVKQSKKVQKEEFSDVLMKKLDEHMASRVIEWCKRLKPMQKKSLERDFEKMSIEQFCAYMRPILEREK